MKIAIVILKFFFISALIIVSNEDLALKDDHSREVFFEIYYSWMGEFFDNAKQMTGYVVNSQWLPDTDEISLKLNSEKDNR